MTDMLMASGALLVCVAVFTRSHPLRGMRRLATLGIAAQYMAGEMAAGAWSRRTRWRECVERAEREAAR